MRKRKMLIICMAVVMIFTACEPMSTKEEKINGDELAKIEKKSPMEIGRHLMMNLSDNIKVDADITGINELIEYKASSFKCTLHTFDEIKSYKQLSDYFDIEEKDAEVEQTEDKLPNGNNMQIVNNTGNENAFDLQVRTVYVWGIDKSCINAATVGFGEDIFQWGVTDVEAYRNIVKEDVDLSFMKENEAEKISREFVENLGIELIEDRLCYAGTYQDYQYYIKQDKQISDYYASIGAVPENFTSSMDAYHFEFFQGYNEIPILQRESEIMPEGVFYIPSRCKILYDSSGIIDFEIATMFDIEKETISEKKKIIDIATILTKFKESMNGVITNGDISIAEIGLAYLPILCDSNNMEYEADPTWYIIYDLPDSFEGGGTRKMNLYNAYTGDSL